MGCSVPVLVGIGSRTDVPAGPFDVHQRQFDAILKRGAFAQPQRRSNAGCCADRPGWPGDRAERTPVRSGYPLRCRDWLAADPAGSAESRGSAVGLMMVGRP